MGGLRPEDMPPDLASASVKMEKYRETDILKRPGRVFCGWPLSFTLPGKRNETWDCVRPEMAEELMGLTSKLGERIFFKYNHQPDKIPLRRFQKP